MEPEKQFNESKICLKFGDDVTQANGLKANFNLHFVSDKQKNIRFNIGEFLGIEIPQMSIVAEFQTKIEGQEAAEKLSNISKQSQFFNELTKDKETNFKIVGKGSKVYVIITDEAIKKEFTNVNKQFSLWTSESVIEDVLKIELSSNNNLQNIKELILTQHKLRALFDSLKVDIKLRRNSATNAILHPLLSQVLIHSPFSVETMMNSFDNFSLEVKCESSKFLEGNAAYKLFLDKAEKVKLNQNFKELKEIFGNEAKLHIFSEGISADLNIVDENLYFIIDLLLA